MSRLALALLACTTLAGPALASEHPQPGLHDRRIRTVPYQADNVVEMHGTIGDTLTIQFEKTVTHIDVAASDRDKEHIDIAPSEPVLFLKPKVALPMQSLFVKTTRADGSIRLYTFRWDAVERSNEASEADATFLVRFTYAGEEAAARAAEWRKGAAARAAWRAEHAAQLAMATQIVSCSNERYVGQGDRSLVPQSICDDGSTTRLHFAGNTRLPAVYMIAPDGKEALTNYSVENGMISIHQTNPHFRLRDGDTVLDIWNKAWSPVGNNPGTGTTSPDVVRVLKVRTP